MEESPFSPRDPVVWLDTGSLWHRGGLWDSLYGTLWDSYLSVLALCLAAARHQVSVFASSQGVTREKPPLFRQSWCYSSRLLNHHAPLHASSQAVTRRKHHPLSQSWCHSSRLPHHHAPLLASSHAKVPKKPPPFRLHRPASATSLFPPRCPSHRPTQAPTLHVPVSAK